MLTAAASAATVVEGRFGRRHHPRGGGVLRPGPGERSRRAAAKHAAVRAAVHQHNFRQRKPLLEDDGARRRLWPHGL